MTIAMDYDEHLARYEAKLKSHEADREEAERRKLIALEEAYREAGEIISGMIQPELEILRAALMRHSFRAKITTKRDVSELSPDSSYEVEIQLREDIDPDNVRRGIIFEAYPHSKCFGVKILASRDASKNHGFREMKFAEMTAQAVQDICATFMERAFAL